MVALYYTDGELLRAPTGIEWTSVPKKGSTAEQQKAERARLIRSGSEFIETEAGQKLVATEDTEYPMLPSRMAQLHPRGLFIKTPLSPIIKIHGVQFSRDGQSWRDVGGAIMPYTRASFYVVGHSAHGEGWLRYQYSNGFPDSKLAAPVGVDDISITLADVTGLQPGDPLTIYDEDSCEDIRVSLTYVPGDTTVPLMSALQFAHDTGVVVSGIPQEVRDACRLAIVHYVRARGRDAIAVSPAGGARQIRAGSATEDLQEAIARLASYKRVI